MGFVRLFFSFQGRISCGQYWLGSFIIFIFGLVAFIALYTIAAPVFHDWVGDSKSSRTIYRAITVVVLIVTPIGLVMNWAGLGLQVKRFHDRGRSGYFAAAPAALSTFIAGVVLSDYLAGLPISAVEDSLGPLTAIHWLVNLAILFDLGVGASVGPNKYGDPAIPPLPRTPILDESPTATDSSLVAAEHAIDRAAEQYKRSPSEARTTHAPAPARGPAPSFGRRVSPT